MNTQQMAFTAGLRALALACIEEVDDALLDIWFEAGVAQRRAWVAESALAARYLGDIVDAASAHDAAKVSAERGNLRCLRWALSRCSETDKADLTWICAWNGHLDCLVYLHEHGCPWNEDACACAAENGHLDCLAYVHEHGCPWNAMTCLIAALEGQLACMRYAHERGCPWDEDTCSFAAWNGHLACLAYAHEHGSPWSAATSRDAALYGKYDCLAYALSHGCPWDEDTCSFAAWNAAGRS